MKKSPSFTIFLPWIASYGSVRSFNVLSLFAIYNESSGSLNLKKYDTERDKLVLQIFVNKHKQRMEGGIGVITAPPQSYLTFSWGILILISL